MELFLELVLFIFVIVICFYLPGKFLLAKSKLTLGSPEDLFLPFVLGIMFFTLISYIFSWLKLEIIILPLFLIIGFFVIKSKKWIPNNIDKRHLIPLSMVIILAIIFSLSMLTTGVYGNNIIYRRDDLWHLALINELKTNFPPDNPGFAVVALRGYHFFYNFLLAKISNIFFISPLSLYFHFFPLFIAILWGLGVYVFMYKWSGKILIALWAVFLTMFGGSFVFILQLQGYKNLSLDSGFGIQQPVSSLVNPPFSISIVIVIAVLLILYQYLKSKEKGWLIPIALCIGLVSMFKVYAGMILFGALIFLTFLEAWKKNYTLIKVCFFAGILFLGTYWILADHSATLFYYPLWAPHKVLIDNMPWYGYEEKQYTYSRLSVIRGMVEIELYSLRVFLLGNIGTRLIGLLLLPLLFLKKRKSPSLFAFSILVMALISILVPLFFIQSGKVFEIIQMAWYFLFFISLFAAFGFHALFSFANKKAIKIILFAIIVILTLPSAYENYKGYFALFHSQGISLSSPYFEAMQFLKSKGSYNETVLEIPDKNIIATKEDLMRWYRGSTPAIVAFSDKRSYLSNEYIDFAGVDIALRIDFIRKIILFNSMSTDDSKYTNLKNEIQQKLKENNISFIYSPYPLSFAEDAGYMHKAFENQTATVYKVDVE